MTRPRALGPCVLVALALALLACGGSSSSTTVPDASGGSGPPADCMARCATRAQACGAPANVAAQACASLCPTVTSTAKLLCLENASCDDLEKLIDHTGTVCELGDPVPAGKFGDACKCDPDGSGGGTFDCSGTNICSSGLRCIGSRTEGVDHGTCRGPVCCTGLADCATALGNQATCASGQQCSCALGLECNGTACTCPGGVPGTEGLCSPAPRG